MACRFTYIPMAWQINRPISPQFLFIKKEIANNKNVLIFSLNISLALQEISKVKHAWFVRHYYFSVADEHSMSVASVRTS